VLTKYRPKNEVLIVVIHVSNADLLLPEVQVIERAVSARQARGGSGTPDCLSPVGEECSHSTTTTRELPSTAATAC
jgi:hypothetical protein